MKAMMSRITIFVDSPMRKAWRRIGVRAILALALSVSGAIEGRSQSALMPQPDIVLQNDGTDWGARINAADAQLAGHRGIIEVDGGGNVATQVVIGSGHILRFGPGTWTNSNTAETFLLKDDTALEGHGWDTIIQEPPGDDPQSYFVVRPYATHLDGAAQAANISVRDIQFSGVGIAKKPNAAPATVNTGLLNRGTYEHLWFNKTHGIGLGVGETNVHRTSVTAYVTVRGCRFTNVGGGIPPDFPEGGGVSLAITNGRHIVVTKNTFVDALGNTFLDIEPNTGDDPVADISITDNTFTQDGSTGVAEPYVYGVVTHTQGGAFGPIKIARNRFRGKPVEWPAGSGKWYPDGYLLIGIYINYYSPVRAHDVTVADNDIKYTSQSPMVFDGVDHSTARNNRMYMMQNNFIVGGVGNDVEGNYVAAAAQEDYCFGIEERSGNFNIFMNNQTTGVSFLKNQYLGIKWDCTKAVSLVGPHSISRRNVVIPRPRFVFGSGTSRETALPEGDRVDR